ncbi:MAG: ABC transporter ATP-binding protein [Betaproteobacteria bacterium SG8_41]|jgi:iron(III) transport system ATP-binding protein|nr:MAG: ABC transporter ATP-binding protein [Betaproteobacteria bacterium SG8_41]
MSAAAPLAIQSTEVTIEDVSVAFGATRVLDNVSLTIKPGEFFAFLGPSGCGKSTLLRLIAGFGESRTGCIRIGGADITRLPPWKRNVGMVFQSYALWPHLTIWDNVAFGLEQRRFAREEISRRVEAALGMVGLRQYAQRRPAQLSGGQQQRVALARTLVIEPQVLLLDEPLSNLDAKLRVQMRHEIVELQRGLGVTTIYVTHDQEEANAIADRMAILNDRVIQQVGVPMEMYDNPANRFVAQFLGIANVLEGEITGRDSQPVFRTRAGEILPLTAGIPRPNGRHIMFRPQSVLLQPSGGPAPTGRAKLTGRVRDAEFLGNIVRYRVSVGEQVLLADVMHRRGEAYFTIGVAVDLFVAPEQLVVLND